MVTSGTTVWNPALVQIVDQALLNAGAIAEGETPSAAMYASAVFQLNAMVKALEATGLHVWKEGEAILFLQPGQGKYVIGAPAGGAVTADADGWDELTLTAPAVAGATAITVNLAIVVAGMNIGVVLDSGITFWTTVNGTPVGNTINVAAALPGSAASGNFALACTAPITRPLKVPTARLLTLNGLNETPMTILSRQEYMDLPQKTSPGTPTQFFYSPQLATGVLYVWPVATTSAWAVRFTWYQPIQDFLAPNNTADFPQEWINPLIWNLSKEIAPSYDVPDAKWEKIKEMADSYAVLAIGYDRESEPIRFGMDYWEYGGDD